MFFLPAIPLTVIPTEEGLHYRGIAVNADGTLFASVHSKQHCVHIYSKADRTADAVIVGTAGTAGSSHGQLDSPAFACFAHRNGVDTLLICDLSNDRVVEVTTSGLFLRAIAMKKGSHPLGIAERDGVIAVSLNLAHAVVLLQYESGAVKPEVTIGSGRGKRLNGHLYSPMGVAFSADGRHILVADWGNHRVSKFSAASGAFVAHAATNGISYPRDVVQLEDGSMVVAQGMFYGNGGLVCVGVDGVTVNNIMIPNANGGSFSPCSLTYSQTLSGLVVNIFEGGGAFLLRDAWKASCRNAWLSALCCS
jgi:DNA-binding beta-propeller fold protein YncE